MQKFIKREGKRRGGKLKWKNGLESGKLKVKVEFRTSKNQRLKLEKGRSVKRSCKRE